MKRLVLIIVFALISGILFTGCSSNKTTDDQTKSESTDKDIEIINVRYLQGGPYSSGGQHPRITVISSKDELGQYHESYSDDFFANSFLVIVLLEAGSTATRYEVERIDKNGNIFINYSDDGMLGVVGAAVMTSWTIIIELNKNSKLKQYEVTLEYKMFLNH